MPVINPVKGTHDIIGDEADGYAYIEDVFSRLASRFGFRHIVTPVLEYTEVFNRSDEESSDMVRKEMYTFLDKGDRSVTLRPEGTAGVMRSIVTNKLYVSPDMPLKYYYSGTAYRYERPQLGRYREFRQIGVECVGADSALLDAETIALAARTLEALGFPGVKLKINTIGDKASREAYKVALKEYFGSRIDDMCADCHERLRLNPMRILDCKVPSDHEITLGAPKMADYLSQESLERYHEVLLLLDKMGIPYEEDGALVRGLDYYDGVVFEVHCLSPEGHDYGAIIGGGHYAGILKAFGGPEEYDVGVGFGLGVERVYSLMKEFGLTQGLGKKVDLYLMPLSKEYLADTLLLADEYRKLGYAVEFPYGGGKLSALFKKAERKGAKFAILYGEDEKAKGAVQVKDLVSQTQEEVLLKDLPAYLAAKQENK